MPPSPLLNASPDKHRTDQPGQVFFRVLPTLLIVAGLLLISYVAAQYAWMYMEQQRFSRELQTQQTQTPANQAAIATQPDKVGAALARLLIPKIHLDVAVVEGTSRKALLAGPGHLVNTALPGDEGNVVLAGHRDTFFRHLGELARGDSIILDRGGKKFDYQVTGTEIVEPGDTEVLSSSSPYQLTLITCYPFHYLGPAPKRYIVFAHLAGSLSDRSSTSPDPSRAPKH